MRVVLNSLGLVIVIGGNSLGQSPTDELLEDMVSEAPGSINFTMFLTMFGEKLAGSFSMMIWVDVFRFGSGRCDQECVCMLRFRVDGQDGGRKVSIECYIFCCTVVV